MLLFSNKDIKVKINIDLIWKLKIHPFLVPKLEKIDKVGSMDCLELDSDNGQESLLNLKSIKIYKDYEEKIQIIPKMSLKYYSTLLVIILML